MLFGQNTFQATITVCVTLVLAFVVTGFASSAYRRERTSLGLIHYSRGQSLQAGGRLEPALEEYRKALLYAPNKTDYRLSLATALLDAGRLDEAQSYLEQLSQANPTSGPINLLLGRLALEQHNLRQAIEYFQRGVYEYWPDSQLQQRRDARWQLANLLGQTGDRSGFMGELMQLYTNLPADALAQKLRVGYLLLANGATSEALRIFQDLVKSSPKNGEAHRGLGEADFNSGEYLSARHEFQRTLRLEPKNQEAARGLELTNEVIDMDAALPYITASEQIRRSKNLLGRVLKNLETCNPKTQPATTSAGGSPPPTKTGAAAADPLAQRLNEAQKLLGETQRSEDLQLTMQKTAAQLWADKASFCKAATPQDHTLDVVLARLGHE